MSMEECGIHVLSFFIEQKYRKKRKKRKNNIDETFESNEAIHL